MAQQVKANKPRAEKQLAHLANMLVRKLSMLEQRLTTIKATPQPSVQPTVYKPPAYNRVFHAHVGNQ
jgi:hypothetical protein